MKQVSSSLKSKCPTFACSPKRARRLKRAPCSFAPRRGQDWGNLPQHVVLQISQHLSLVDRAWASSVCRCWNDVLHTPDLWRRFEFELNQPASSYLRSTHPDLVQQIIKKHAQHLQYVSFKVHQVDSCTESAEAACDILSQLVNCTIKTLGLISTARPSFMDVSQVAAANDP